MGHLNQVQELLPLVNNGGTTVLATLWQLHTNFKHWTAGHVISKSTQQVSETSFLHTTSVCLRYFLLQFYFQSQYLNHIQPKLTSNWLSSCLGYWDYRNGT